MAKIFKQQQDLNNRPNRNSFDLSFQNHLTMKMGGIYPFMCKEVVPGDTFKINTAFGLKFMPLVFPVQSRMRAHVSYFYVPNRIVWPNFKNWVSGLEDHVHPYISQSSSFFKTGSIADYLDVPTTVCNNIVLSSEIHSNTGVNVGAGSRRSGFSYTELIPAAFASVLFDEAQSNRDPLYFINVNEFFEDAAQSSYYSFFHFDVPLPDLVSVAAGSGLSSSIRLRVVDSRHSGSSVGNINIPATLVLWLAYGSSLPVTTEHSRIDVLDPAIPIPITAVSPSSLRVPVHIQQFNSDYVRITFDDPVLWESAAAYARAFQDMDDTNNPEFPVFDVVGTPNVFMSLVISDANLTAANFYSYGAGSVASGKPLFKFTGDFRIVANHVEVADAAVTPFATEDGNTPLRISALPFRAYDMIVNSYFTNDVLQPLVDPTDDSVVYNRFLVNDKDGADTYPYKIRFRNYELDYLTSGMPSPQFGNAPLVGISALGELRLEDENGISTYKADFDDDGNITSVVATSAIASVNHARTAMNLAQLGININDLRSTNAFQRFLENTMRKMSNRYKDFTAAHFDVEPKHMELDMPIYIGGVSKDVTVNQITNMTAGNIVDGKSVPLGEFAGTAGCFGQTENTVTHYCDDFGFIIGVVSIVPDPAYSQLLPKHYLKNVPLDYYFPEFSQIGMQPVTYEQVTPVTAFQQQLAGDGLLTDTFCYQRPNYDLVSSTDQVHGEFRLSLKDYLINRIFYLRPELSSDFVRINPSEVNDVFAYRNADEDTIVGQIVVDVKATRPVPRVVVPSLS